MGLFGSYRLGMRSFRSVLRAGYACSVVCFLACVDASAQELLPRYPDTLSHVRSLVDKAELLYRSDELVGKFQLLQEAGRQMDRVQDVALVLHYQDLMGHTLWDLGATDVALGYYRAAITTSKRIQPGRSNMPWRYLGQMGAAYLELHQLDSALFYFRLARDAAHGMSGPWFASSLNNLGMAHLQLGEFGAALAYYDSATAALRSRDAQSRLLAVSILDNRADVALAMDRVEDALPIVRTNLDSLLRIGLEYDNGREKYARYRFKYVDLLLRAGRADEAVREMDGLERFVRGMGDRLDPQVRMKLADARFRFARAQGDASALASAAQALVALRDSLSEVRARESSMLTSGLADLSTVRLKGEMDAKLRLTQAEARAADDRARSRTVLALLVTLFSVITILSLTMWWRARVRRKQTEKELLGMELEHKRRDLQQMGLEFAHRKERAEALEQLASDLDRADGDGVAAVAADLKAKASAEVRLEERREWLHQQVETVNSAFYEALRTRYPQLAPTEVELCGLIRSGFSNKEVAELRSITPKSARMARYRLKRRLGITGDIEEVLRAM